MKFSILLLLSLSLLFARGSGKSFYSEKNYRASLCDSVRVTSSTLFSGPTGSVEMQILDSGCTVVLLDGDYSFYTCRLGVYRMVFRSRSTGGLESDTITVTVTDEPPVIELRNREIEADLGKPMDLGLSLNDDGDKLKFTVDFDGDNKSDTIIWNERHPVLRYTRPTLKGETSIVLRPRFKVTDNDGRTAMDSAVVNLNYRPPRSKAGDNTIYCVDERIVFSGARCRDANEDGYVRKFEWDFDGDGKADTTAALPEVEYAFSKAGDYMVELKAIDNDGNVSVPDTAFITVIRERPVISIMGPHEAKQGQAFTMVGTGKASCGEIDGYFWDFEGDGKWEFSSHSHGKAVWTFPGTGLFQAKFLIIDSKGDSASQIWPIKALP